MRMKNRLPSLHQLLKSTCYKEYLKQKQFLVGSERSYLENCGIDKSRSSSMLATHTGWNTFTSVWDLRGLLILDNPNYPNGFLNFLKFPCVGRFLCILSSSQFSVEPFSKCLPGPTFSIKALLCWKRFLTTRHCATKVLLITSHSP